MTGPRLTPDQQRAVSDAVGFALTFAVVVVAVALVYSLGVGTLYDLQDAQRVENAERAFDTFADNLNDVSQEGAPGRSTEFQLGGGQISGADLVEFTVSVEGDPNATQTIGVTPVEYRISDTSMYYVSGAVLRTDRGGGRLDRQPPFRFADDVTVLSFIQTSGPRNQVGGEGTVRITGRETGPTTVERVTGGNGTTPPFNITFNVSTTAERAPVWKRYLETQLGDGSCDIDDETTVSCKFATDRLYVRRTSVDVRVAI